MNEHCAISKFTHASVWRSLAKVEQSPEHFLNFWLRTRCLRIRSLQEFTYFIMNHAGGCFRHSLCLSNENDPHILADAKWHAYSWQTQICSLTKNIVTSSIHKVSISPDLYYIRFDPTPDTNSDPMANSSGNMRYVPLGCFPPWWDVGSLTIFKISRETATLSRVTVMTTVNMSQRCKLMTIQHGGGHGNDADGSIVFGDEFLSTKEIRGVCWSLHPTFEEKSLRPGVVSS